MKNVCVMPSIVAGSVVTIRAERMYLLFMCTLISGHRKLLFSLDLCLYLTITLWSNLQQWARVKFPAVLRSESCWYIDFLSFPSSSLLLFMIWQHQLSKFFEYHFLKHLVTSSLFVEIKPMEIDCYNLSDIG